LPVPLASGEYCEHTRTPVKAVNAIFRTFARVLDQELGPDQKHVTVRDDGAIGIDTAAAEVCLQQLGFKVLWQDLAKNTTLEHIAFLIGDHNQWVILRLQSDKHDVHHAVAFKDNKVWDNNYSGLFAAMHPYRDVAVFTVGFVSRRNDDAEGMDIAA
jgi:hypothetical protein